MNLNEMTQNSNPQDLPFEQTVGCAHELPPAPTQFIPAASDPHPNRRMAAPEPRVYRQSSPDPDYVEPGKVFPARIIGSELTTSAKGCTFLKMRIELDHNRWRMTHNHFFPFKNLPAEEKQQIANTFVNRFPLGKCVAEIGSYQGRDGKDHLCVENIYLDEAERLGVLAAKKNGL